MIQYIYSLGADLISQEISGKTYTYLYDGHGSVTALSDESGKITDTYSYDAFGNLLKSTGRTANNYRYCGEQFDSTTGLYYLRARYMDTNTGRFISQDSYAGSTYDPASLHKYLYANSNPVMYTDPSGYMSLGETVIAGAIMGALSNGFFTVGLNILKNLDETGEFAVTVSPGEIAISMIIGGLLGVTFSLIAVYCIQLAILAALYNGFKSLSEAIDCFINGDNYQGIGYSLLSLISFKGAHKLYNIYANNGMVQVTRYGSAGIKDGDWVMKGGDTKLNYILSFKWSKTGGNIPANRSSVSQSVVSITELQAPKWGYGIIDGPWKVIFNQYQYYPNEVNFSFYIVSYLFSDFFTQNENENNDEYNKCDQ